MSKVAVVTGAARGIGLTITGKFLETGYRVVLLDSDAAGVGLPSLRNETST